MAVTATAAAAMTVFFRTLVFFIRFRFFGVVTHDVSPFQM